MHSAKRRYPHAHARFSKKSLGAQTIIVQPSRTQLRIRERDVLSELTSALGRVMPRVFRATAQDQPLPEALVADIGRALANSAQLIDERD